LGNITKSIEISAPPEKVFNFIADFNNMNTLHEGYTQAIVTPSNQTIVLGTTAHFINTAGGSKTEWDMKVTEFEKNRKLRWQSEKPLIVNILTFEPTSRGTKFTHQTVYELPYSVFGKLLDKVSVSRDVDKELEFELEKTKKALEN
jgi:uncharacterized membrane protein